MINRTLLRRLQTIAYLALALLSTSTAADDIDSRTLTDLTGRHVEVPAKVDRVLLGEGRFMAAIAILDRDNPIERIVGMQGDFERVDQHGYALYQARFPGIDDIARVGQVAPSSFSAEKAIALMPDVAFFGLEGHGPSPKDTAVIEQLERAGVAIVFVDFRRKPLVNAPRSIELMGRVLGRETRAAEYVETYRRELARVTQVSSRLLSRPSVFIENRVGLQKDCCATMGDGMMGSLVEAAGGYNVAKPLVSGTHGMINLEYLLRVQPDFYIGTAIGNAKSADAADGRLLLGPGIDGDHARTSLGLALERRGIAQLKAIRSKHTYGIWHHFYDSPFNVIAVQAFAKWLHPDAFTDLDPEATLHSMYERFQPIPSDGTYWVGPS